MRVEPRQRAIGNDEIPRLAALRAIERAFEAASSIGGVLDGVARFLERFAHQSCGF